MTEDCTAVILCATGDRVKGKLAKVFQISPPQDYYARTSCQILLPSAKSDQTFNGRHGVAASWEFVRPVLNSVEAVRSDFPHYEMGSCDLHESRRCRAEMSGPSSGQERQ